MRDFNEIKKALWISSNIPVNYSYINKTFFSNKIAEDKVHSLAELCYRYRTEFPATSAAVNVRTRHRSPLSNTDTKSSSIIPSGLQALVNDLCNKYLNYRIYHFTNADGSPIIRLSITYKSLWKDDAGLLVPVTIIYETSTVKSTTIPNLQTSSVIGIATKELSIQLSKYSNIKDVYFGIPNIAYSSTGNGAEILSIEPMDNWKDADKKEEPVLHKFSYVVNISANPAVLKVYAKNDAVEKCSLDADKYVDTDLNKVVYTATYANGATATIDYWSYDENEELVVYQNLNCTLGERIKSW